MISPRLASSSLARILREKGEREDLAGCSKRLSRKAAASEEARRTLRYVESLSEVRTPLAGFFSGLMLLNACLALQPPHILHDLINICRSDGVDLRHVAEFPMVCFNAVGRSPLEGLIPVVVRFIDFMH
jgi:hypothetical protein